MGLSVAAGKQSPHCDKLHCIKCSVITGNGPIKSNVSDLSRRLYTVMKLSLIIVKKVTVAPLVFQSQKIEAQQQLPEGK